MRYPLLVKALTLLSFTFLISVFLLYREGRFNKYLLNESSSLQTSHNGGTITSNQGDSTKAKKDSLPQLLLSSSKSIILIDKKRGGTGVTPKNLRQPVHKPVTEIMSSSKSTTIFRPALPLIIVNDSPIYFRYDTVKRKSIKKQ